MKTSEQMTQDVLKRRDEELKALPKKRRIKMAAIGAPCMAATAAFGIVTFNFVHGANEFVNVYGGSLEDYTYAFFHGGRGRYIHNALATPGSTETGTELGDLMGASYQIPYEDWINKNPNAGKYVYRVTYMKDIYEIMAKEKPAPDIEPTDFIKQDVKQINMRYEIEFDRFGRLHPDWIETHEQFGNYVHDEYTSEYASRQFLSDQNTLNYVTPDGAEISVTAQSYQKFFDDKYEIAWDDSDGDGLIGEVPKLDPPEYPALDGGYIQDADGNVTEVSGNKPDHKSYNIYDDDGNIIGAYTPGYNPGNTGVVTDNNKPDEVKTTIYNNFEGTEWLTYLDMGHTWVRIHIKGIPGKADIIKLLEEYTADQSWLDDINSLNNPYHGKYSFKFVSGESGILGDSGISGIEGYPAYDALSTPEYVFKNFNTDDLSNHYGFDFDRLGRLHPDWSKTNDRPLGIYYTEESPIVDALTVAYDYNTLNYTTPDGAKISVTARTDVFYPSDKLIECIVIGKGPFIVLDEDGNKLDEYEFGFEPHFNVNIPGGTENIEVEIYSDRNAPDTHLVYINMGSWVRIRAEGFSDAEFLKLVKEFIK